MITCIVARYFIIDKKDLKQNRHVKLTLGKIKQAAARIRALGDHPKKTF